MSSSNEILRFDEVWVRFEEKPAIRDISLVLRPGETLVIYGAAASGKSVLLKTSIGLLHASAGRVHLFGHDITDWKDEQLYTLRQSVGVLFQEGGLFDSLTVAENVAYPLQNHAGPETDEGEIRERVQNALDFVELGMSGDQFPAELSGGMRRRVGIARAMVAEPALMLYDSPTAGLDPITAYRIMTLIVRQRDQSSATSVVLTHRHQDGGILANYRYDSVSGQLRAAEEDLPNTRFIVLREGSLVFEGSQMELRGSLDPYISRFAGKHTSEEFLPCSPRTDLAGDFLQFRS